MKLLGIGLCSDCGCSANAGGDNNTKGQVDFTYDEGKGVKDTIVMDGPLSSIYANALNIYFAKKPIESKDQESLSKAFESMAIDAMLKSNIEDSEDSEENSNTKIMEGYNIVSSNSEITNNPNTVIYTTSANNVSIDGDIEVIEASHDRVKNAGKEFMLFVGPTIGVDGEVSNIYDYIDFNSISKINAFNISDKFSRSTESFFETRGIPVVVGFENLVKWLKNKAKDK